MIRNGYKIRIISTSKVYDSRNICFDLKKIRIKKERRAGVNIIEECHKIK